MRRRDLLIGGAATALGAGLGARWSWARAPGRGRGAGRPNILLISIDDMKPWIGPHGFAAAHTPNLDRLAQRGLIFRNAYCAAPACSPSRAAVFTGLAPHQTGCYGNQHSWLRTSPGAVTFPRLLKDAGYFTAGFGKLFHIPSHDDDGAWSLRRHYRLYKMPNAPVNAPKSIYRRSGSRFDWAALDVPVEEMDDHHQVDRAARAMKTERSRPWFVAVGLFRPHLPWYVPRRFFDLHPLESVPLPPTIPNDLDDVPAQGRKWAKSYEHRVLVSRGLWREAVQAYMASISYVDYELGRLLAQTPPGTIVIIWSDHGWHLGPKNHWHKYALWEEATQTVFAMTGPGIAAGARCTRTVSLNDIYPTIAELCELPAPPGLAGRSVLPLTRDPSAGWNRPALTTWWRGNHAIRSERYRYIRYADGGEELYDHWHDPHEWTNLAGKPEVAHIVEAHAAHLPERNARAGGAGSRRKQHSWLELPDGRRALIPA